MQTLLLMLVPYLSTVAALSADSNIRFSPHDDRLYLPAIPSMVFTDGQVTFSRQGMPHPQLACVGGNAKDDKDARPQHVECFNGGIRPPRNAEERKNPRVRFTCIPSPSFPSFELRNYRVKCEGYAYEQDLYVVKGSCYLQFELWKTGKAGPGPGGREEHTAVGGDEPGFLASLWSIVQCLLVLCALAALVMFAQKCKRDTEGMPVDSERAGLLSPPLANAA